MLKKLMIILLVMLMMIGIGVFWICHNFLPEKEERIAYDKEKRIQQIDKQLLGIDLESVRAKSAFIMEKSIDDLQIAIRTGKLSYEELTAFYLDRIRTIDLGPNGLNATVEINPNVMAEARACDHHPEKGHGLTGIPVLLKDNINTKNMPSSAGTLALKDFLPKENASLVDALLKSNAILLGKSNLSELANFMDYKMPSGYSSKAGQTHNPFDPIKLSPLGSSSGSGVAVAANLTAVAIGTETTGSIIAPATIQSIVGFKPKKGAISTEGVLPLSSTLDTVGTMAKTVKDAVALYNVLKSNHERAIDLDSNVHFIKGKRIGIVGDQSDHLKKALQATGAIPVTVEPSEKGIDNSYIINQDFKRDLKHYLKTYSAPIHDLSELIAFNKANRSRRAKYGQRFLKKANQVKGFDKEKVREMVKKAQTSLDSQFQHHHLDAIVFYDNYGVLLPAVAGYPEMTVPVGQNKKGQPIGATFVSLNNQEQKLYQLAYSFEQLTKGRLIPQKYLSHDERK